MIKFIFLVGRTLIDEQNYFSFIDSRLLYLLNQFGAKIDNKNYFAIKNDVIKSRKLSKNRVEELVIQICRVLMPNGYEKVILRYILPSIEFAEKHLLYPYDDSVDVLKTLAKNFRIGIIGSNERELSRILKIYGMDRYIKFCVLSCKESNEPNIEIFKLILNMLGITPSETLLVGDRLDSHVYLANSLGMASIWISNTRFKLQEVTNQYEVPKLTISNLRELSKTVYIQENLNA
ncbi:MAG TPA: HAD family hydrolase [Nitrososphaeraceae archaeon]|nr:HAD family hydrolase [Nitrososphaeraceae archaeon]